jgi:hypothetical protein
VDFTAILAHQLTINISAERVRTAQSGALERLFGKSMDNKYSGISQRYYSTRERDIFYCVCNISPAGSYCETAQLAAPSGVCDASYYCIAGSSNRQQNICLKGLKTCKFSERKRITVCKLV